MGATKPSEFIGSGAMGATKPYEFIGFGAMGATKRCEFIGFGAMGATKPYEFTRFGAMGGTKTQIRPAGGRPAGGRPIYSLKLGFSLMSDAFLHTRAVRVGPGATLAESLTTFLKTILSAVHCQLGILIFQVFG